MSVRHLKQSIALNRQHAADHAKAAASGPVGSKKYNKAHAKAHKKQLAADQKLLKKNRGS